MFNMILLYRAISLFCFFYLFEVKSNIKKNGDIMIKKFIVLMLTVVFLSGLSVAQEKKKEEIKLDAKSCINKCIEFIKSNDPENAIKFGEKAVELDGKNSKYHFQLGLAYNAKLNHKNTGMMEKMNYATKMLDSFKNAVKFDKNNLDARIGLMRFYLNAPPIAGGSVEKAEEQVKEIIKHNELLGYSAYVSIYSKNKEFDKAKGYAIKAFKQHMALKKKNPEKRTSFNVNVLNGLGYGFVNSGKIKEAIEVFEMNIKAFPKHFNTYDSLAETYMNNGKTKLAIKYYEKALKLNPNKTQFEKTAFENEKKYLEKLKKGKT